MKGTIVAHVPGIPVPLFNHATSVNVHDDEAEDFLNRVIGHF